jgi:hypothetical protein
MISFVVMKYDNPGALSTFGVSLVDDEKKTSMPVCWWLETKFDADNLYSHLTKALSEGGLVGVSSKVAANDGKVVTFGFLNQRVLDLTALVEKLKLEKQLFVLRYKNLSMWFWLVVAVSVIREITFYYFR